MSERELGVVWSDRFPGGYVSTIYRESSAMEHLSPYFETMAFRDEYDPGEGIAWHSAASYEKEARRQHDLALRWFSRSGR